MVKSSTLLGIGVAGLGAVALFKPEALGLKPKPDNGEDEQPDCIECINGDGSLLDPCFVIQDIQPRQQGAENFWIFDVAYKNRSCNTETVSIIMSIKDVTGRTIKFENKRLTFQPKQSRGFEWRVIFTDQELLNQPFDIEFFVWDSINNPVPLSNTESLML